MDVEIRRKAKSIVDHRRIALKMLDAMNTDAKIRRGMINKATLWIDAGKDENTQLLTRCIQMIFGEMGLRDLMNRWSDQHKHEKEAEEMITALSGIMTIIMGGERTEADGKSEIESLENDPGNTRDKDSERKTDKG